MGKTNRSTTLTASLALALLAACGGSGGTKDTTTPTGPQATLEVRLSLGSPIAGAKLTATAVDDAGATITVAGEGGVVGTATTGADGTASIKLTAGYEGLVQVVASGAGLEVVDPVTGTPVALPSGWELSSYAYGFKAGETVTVVITGLTTLADAEALAYARGRHPASPTVQRLAVVLPLRDALFPAHMAGPATWPAATLRSTIPASLTTAPLTLNDAGAAALFDVVLSQLAHATLVQAGFPADGTDINAYSLLALLVEDLAADAVFDGKGASGAQLQTIGTSPVALSAQTLRAPLAQALDNFIQGGANKTGWTRLSIYTAGLYDRISMDASDLFGAAPDGSFSLPSSPPTVAFQGAIPSVTNTASQPITVRVSDTGWGYGPAYLTLNGGAPVTMNTSSPGIYTASVQLTAGANTLLAWATDGAGHSGAGQSAPYSASASTLLDVTPPAMALVPYPQYQDERGMSIGLNASGNAVVPAVYGYAAPAKIAPLAGPIYKAATRLSTSLAGGSTAFMAANPDNVPTLLWRTPSNHGGVAGAPLTANIASASFTATLACAGCTTVTVTGDLPTTAAPSTYTGNDVAGFTYFQLPLATNWISALGTLTGPVSIDVVLSASDEAGNSWQSATGTWVATFNVVGPPVAVVREAAYATQNDKASTYPYLANTLMAGVNRYDLLWDPAFTAFGADNVVRLERYYITNPAPFPVALTPPAISGTWSISETWPSSSQFLGQQGVFLSPTVPGYTGPRWTCSTCAALPASCPEALPGGAVNGTTCWWTSNAGYANWSKANVIWRPTQGSLVGEQVGVDGRTTVTTTAASSPALTATAEANGNPAPLTTNRRYIVPAAVGSSPGLLLVYVARPRATVTRTGPALASTGAYTIPNGDQAARPTAPTGAPAAFLYDLYRLSRTLSVAPETWSGSWRPETWGITGAVTEFGASTTTAAALTFSGSTNH